MRGATDSRSCSSWRRNEFQVGCGYGPKTAQCLHRSSCAVKGQLIILAAIIFLFGDATERSTLDRKQIARAPYARAFARPIVVNGGVPARRQASRQEQAPQGKSQSARPWKELRSKFDKSWRTFPKSNTDAKRTQSRLVRSRSVEEVLEHMEVDLDKWAPINIATAWHRLGKYARRHPNIGDVHQGLRKLANSLDGRDLNEFSPRELANILYAWGITSFQRAKLLKKIVNHIEGRLDEFDTQGLSNVVYALGRLGFVQDQFLDLFCLQVDRKLADFSSQEIANVLYSLGRLDFKNEDFLTAVCDHVQYRLNEFSAQELTNSVYALHRLNFRYPPFLKAACTHGAAQLPRFNPQNIANFVYALRQLEYRSRVFAMRLSLHLPSRVEELKRAKLLDNIVDSLMEMKSGKRQRKQAAEQSEPQPHDEVESS